MKSILIYIAIICTAHLAESLYQDYPSLTGFYDHTSACYPMIPALQDSK